MWLRKRALTLVETVVTCTLLSLAVTVMASSFAFFTKSGLRYNQRQQMLTLGQHALHRILAQVAQTDSTAVTITTGATISLPSNIQIVYFPLPETAQQNTVRFDSSTGKPNWQSWDAFEWVPTTGLLSEGQQNCTATTSLTSLVSPISSLTSWKIIPLASLVTGFSFTGPSSGTFAVSLTLQDSQGYQVQLSSTVQALN